MLCQEMEEIASVQKHQRLPLCELIGIGSEVRSRHQDALACSFVYHGSVQVPHSLHSNSVGIAFGLNDGFSASDRIRIECDRVHAPISTCLSYFDLSSVACEFLLEYFPHEGFEI